MRKTLTTLIYGDPGMGKTPIALTAPKPMLLLDAEGGANYATAKYHTVEWRPWEHGSEPPKAAADAEVVRCIVRDWESFRVGASYVRQGPKGRFQTVNLDSITELQKRCKDSMGPSAFGGKTGQQDWGVLLVQMEGVVRKLRDLVTEEYLNALVVTATADEIKGKTRPAVQGGLAIQLPAHVALIGYLNTFRDADNQKHRGMQIQGDDRVIAKDRTSELLSGGVTGVFGEVVPAPINLTNIIEQIH